MSFYSAPHYIVLGDVCADYAHKIEDTFVVNPGNFSKDYSFGVIYPVIEVIQPSKLP